MSGMNQDPIRVGQFDLWSIFPSLRILQSVGFALGPGRALPAGVAAILLAGLSGSMESADRLAVDSLGGPILRIMSWWKKSLTEGFQLNFAFVAWIVSLMILSVCGVLVSASASGAFGHRKRSGWISSGKHALRSWRAQTLSLGIYLILTLILTAGFRATTGIRAWMSSWISESAFWTVSGTVGTLFCLLGLWILQAGWLLSLVAIAVDDCDGAEALSRGISYVLSRFWRAIACVAAVLFLSAASGSLFQGLCLSAGEILVQTYKSFDSQLALSAGSNSSAAAAILKDAWIISSTFCGMAVTYLLLRRFEDGVSLSEER